MERINKKRKRERMATAGQMVLLFVLGSMFWAWVLYTWAGN